MNCPKCDAPLNPAHHWDLVCDGQVWCRACRSYPWELTRYRDFSELTDWCNYICQVAACGQVILEGSPAPLHDPDQTTFVRGEADHRQRTITLYGSGYTLLTLCHELAHLFSGRDHSPAWAKTLAVLVAWISQELKGNYHLKLQSLSSN